MVREAARRTLKMRHFDVQLIGGIALHKGKIAEMRTGEGKTLVATLPAYLNALPGEGVHVVTVNEYLAQRDADWMGPVYRFLGLTVGVIKNAQEPAGEARRLRLRHHLRHQQRIRLRLPARQSGLTGWRSACSAALTFAIVDEVDSILIDEARTPLIISGPAEESTELYLRINELVPRLHAPADRRTARATSRSRRRPSRCTSPRPATSASSSSCCRRGCCAKARACTTPPTSA